MPFANIMPNNSISIDEFEREDAIRSIPADTFTGYLKIGSVSGIEKEFTVGVHYVEDHEDSKPIIVVRTSLQGYKYNSLIGCCFSSLDELKQVCLKTYTPTHLD